MVTGQGLTPPQAVPNRCTKTAISAPRPAPCDDDKAEHKNQTRRRQPQQRPADLDTLFQSHHPHNGNPKQTRSVHNTPYNKIAWLPLAVYGTTRTRSSRTCSSSSSSSRERNTTTTKRKRMYLPTHSTFSHYHRTVAANDPPRRHCGAPGHI